MGKFTLEMPRSAFEERFAAEFNFQRDFSSEKFANFLNKSKTEGRMADEESIWKKIGRLQNGEFMLNNAGLLFFAQEPGKFIMQNVVSCIRYHGNTKISMIDRKDLQSDLLSMIDDAEAFVKKHTRIASKIVEFTRIDVEEYPYEAIREAIINAICHRNYDIKTDVFVNIFDDRVEVISPGGLPDELTLKEVQGKSFPRNPLIASLLKEAHYVEKSGSGLEKMKNLMKKHGLQEPIYDAGRAFFQVTFLSPGDKILDLIKPTNEVDLRELGLNERQIKVLNYMQEKGVLMRKEIERFLGTTKKTATRDLSELIEKGFVKREGESKRATYRLVK